MTVSPMRVTHREASIEISIDGKRYRAKTIVAMLGDTAINIDTCHLRVLPPRAAFLRPAEVEDAEVIHV